MAYLKHFLKVFVALLAAHGLVSVAAWLGYVEPHEHRLEVAMLVAIVALSLAIRLEDRGHG